MVETSQNLVALSEYINFTYAQVTVAVALLVQQCLKVPACQGSLAVDPDSES